MEKSAMAGYVSDDQAEREDDHILFRPCNPLCMHLHQTAWNDRTHI
jgi:hypothetical protein